MSFKFASCRRFSIGRIVTNKDATEENAWACNSELGICGRPLTDARVLMPLSREILLPENLDPDADLRHLESQERFNESLFACFRPVSRQRPSMKAFGFCTCTKAHSKTTCTHVKLNASSPWSRQHTLIVFKTQCGTAMPMYISTWAAHKY